MFTRGILRLVYERICEGQRTRSEFIRDAQGAAFNMVFDEYVKILLEHPDVFNLMWELVVVWRDTGRDAEEYEAAMDAFERVNGKPFLYFFTKQLRHYDEQNNIIWNVVDELYTYNFRSYACEDVSACIYDSNVREQIQMLLHLESVVAICGMQLQYKHRKHELKKAIERVVDSRIEYVEINGRTKRVVDAQDNWNTKRTRFV